MDVLHKN